MRSISNRSVFFRLFFLPFLLAMTLYDIDSGRFLIPDAHATEDLPSQKARFAGMSATFKAKKKEAEEAEKKEAEEKATKEAEEQEKRSAGDEAVTYFKLHTFVVNVIDERDEDKLLFLTLEIFCKIKNSDDRWLINHNLAPIKDTIITYISGLNRQEIQTQKQKKTLQKELTRRVDDTLKKLTGKKVISNLYLTRIIVQ